MQESKQNTGSGGQPIRFIVISGLTLAIEMKMFEFEPSRFLINLDHRTFIRLHPHVREIYSMKTKPDGTRAGLNDK